MTTLGTTDHADAAMTRLSAVVQPWMSVVRLDRAAGVDTDYIEIVAERRYLLDPRVYPSTSLRLWRLTCTWVASTVRNGDALEAACHAALEGYSLLVGGDFTTPIQHETTEATAQDKDRRWSGFVDFTYSI